MLEEQEKPKNAGRKKTNANYILFFTQFPQKKDRIAEKNCFRDKKGAKRLSTKPIVTVNRNERKTRKKGVDL